MTENEKHQAEKEAATAQLYADGWLDPDGGISAYARAHPGGAKELFRKATELTALEAELLRMKYGGK